MFYYFLPWCAFVAAVISYSKYPKYRNLYYCGLFFLFFLIIYVAGFRYQVGADWYSYLDIFLGYKEAEEVSTGFISNVLKFLSCGYQVFVFVYFLLSFVLKLWLFNRLSSSFAISLLIYLGFWFLVYDLNGIRQGMSLSFTGIAFYFAYRRRLRYYLLFVLAAISFHASAICFLPFYWMVKLKVSYFYQVVVLCLVVCLAYFHISEWLLLLLGEIIGESYLTNKALSYALSDAFGTNIIFSFTTVHRILIFFLTLFVLTKINIDNNLKQALNMTAFINIIIYFLFCQYEIIATRLSLPFRFTECILFSFIPFVFKSHSRIFAILLILIYVEWQVYQTLSIPNGGLLPYKNIFII